VGGEDAADPATIGSHLLSPRRGGIRVGVLPFPSDEDDVTRAVFAEALGVLRGLTGSMIDVALPAYDYRDLYDRIHVAETALAMREFVAHGDVDQVVDEAQRAGLHGYATLDPFDYVDATETRVAATRALRRMFTDIDVLVAPTLLSEATPLEADLRTWPARRRHYAVVGAVTGIPGVTVPMGFGESGLPLGLSILADVGHDRTALALAAAYQRATDWHRRVPTALAG
jgi:aspartyl-tRNA(Asn)/glutamyl-tRNA(Gln) amidotransferase subunit A